jgi:hypothetical protein
MIRSWRHSLRERLRRAFSGKRPRKFAMDLEHKTRAIKWSDEDRPARRDWWARHQAERDAARGYRIPEGRR